MKIHTIQNDISHGYKLKPRLREKETSVGLCEKNSSVVTFNGSRASKKTSEAAVKVFNNLGHSISDKLFQNKKFQKLVEIFETKTVVAQSLVALVVAGIFRPATNMAMAGKEDREDSMYAASHAIASAIIGFVVSSIVMAPFDKAFRKVKDNPKKYLQGLENILGVKEIGKRKLEKSRPYKNISKVAQMIPDTVVLGVPKAMMTIALIPPILKYVFGLEKKSKSEPKKEQMNSQNQLSQIIHNSKLGNIIGGAKC